MEHECRVCATQPAWFVFDIDVEHVAPIFLCQRLALPSLLFTAEVFCCQTGVPLGVTTGQLIFSLASILLATRVFGWLAQRIGQPQVVGEMIAGIVLGPSLFARFFPGPFAYVFPATVLPALTVLSQLGLLLFMFAVGLEVDLGRILKQKSSVILISNVSIILPMVLGIGVARMLIHNLPARRHHLYLLLYSWGRR